MGFVKIGKSGRASNFEKYASFSVILQNTPEDWDQEILELAYKNHPWLQEFELVVEFLKKLPDRRYGIGGIKIIPTQVVPNVTSASSDRKETKLGDAIAEIPIIIREGELAPLDVFVMDGKVFPLDEETFKRKMLSLNNPSETGIGFGDQTIIGHLWPAARALYTEPIGTYGLNLLTKTSSYNKYTESINFNADLDKIAGVLEEELSEGEGFPLLSSVMSGELAVNKERLERLAKIACEDPDLEPIAAVLDELAATVVEKIRKGSVVQIYKDGDSIVFRTTYPEQFTFARISTKPVDLSGKALPIIVSSEERDVSILSPEDDLTPEVSDVPDSGLYSCAIRSGKDIVIGKLYSSVLDLDGTPLPLKLFSDALSRIWSAPKKVMIISIKPLRALPYGQMIPGMTGSFRIGTGLSVPITVKSYDRDLRMYKVAVHDSRMLGSDILGEREVKLAITPAVKEAAFDEKRNLLLVPASWDWVPLGEKRAELLPPLVDYEGVVKLQKLASNQYLFEGPAVGEVLGGPVNRLDAEFTLAALGVPVSRIEDVLDHAERGVKLANCNILKPYRDEKIKLVDDIDYELVKAAAVLDNPNSVDAVLGLQVAELEPDDNLLSIASHLEDAQQKVAKLLLLSRLGFYTIPEGAAKVVMQKLTPLIDAARLLGLERAMSK